MSKGLYLSGIKTETPIIVLVESETGTCGEDWGSIHVVPAGVDIDDFAFDIAKENASTYDNNGHYICPECEGEYSDEYCEDCEANCYWQENDNISGEVYKYHPSQSYAYVNGGDPIKEVIQQCILLGGISEDEGSYNIHWQRMEQLLHLPLDTREEDVEIIVHCLKNMHK